MDFWPRIAVTATACTVILLASVAGAQRGDPRFVAGSPPMSAGPGGPPPGFSRPYTSVPSFGGPGSYQGGGPSIPATRFGNIPSYGSNSPSINRSQSGPIPGSYPPAVTQSRDPREAVPPDTSRMQQALRQRDYDQVGEEVQGVRRRTENLENIGPQLPVQDRLKLPLINYKYRQGIDIIDQGSNERDESKVKMGIQQINEANERLGHLENEIRPQPSNRGGDRSERGGETKSQGRRGKH